MQEHSPVFWLCAHPGFQSRTWFGSSCRAQGKGAGDRASAGAVCGKLTCYREIKLCWRSRAELDREIAVPAAFKFGVELKNMGSGRVRLSLFS